MERTDVLVVGGSAAGVVAATTAKATYPDKRVVLIRKDELSLVPCGIPYVFEVQVPAGNDPAPSPPPPTR